MPHAVAGTDIRPLKIILLALVAASLAWTLVAPPAADARSGGPRLERLRHHKAVQRERIARLKVTVRSACRAGRAADCRRQRQRLRRARARLARLARVQARVSGQSRREAPVLSVSGTTVKWARVADVNRHVLATTVPGRSTTYRVVEGLSTTPPAVPGKTVNYGLRTDVAGSRWAREVKISYSATGTPTPAPSPTPAPAPAPAPTLPAGAPGFEAGIVSGSDLLNEAKVTGKLGARVARVEFSIDEPVANMRAVIAAHAANGTRVLPLAGFHGTMPTQAEARNLGTWAKEFGPGGAFWAGRSDGRLAVREIEFGNETSYGYQYGDNWDKPTYVARAREYALRFRDAQEAISAAIPGVGLLAQGDDANTGSSNWVDGMFAAVPDLASRVAGWTIHPYGPRTKWQPRIERLIKQTGARGASSAIPIWITEWGLSSDDGRCLTDNYGWDKCMTYASAASAVSSSAADMRAAFGSRLRALLLFQGRDQRASGVSTNREHYFGALHSDMTDKGAYSAAVRALLAAS
jgi:hypothetical protein